MAHGRPIFALLFNFPTLKSFGTGFLTTHYTAKINSVHIYSAEFQRHYSKGENANPPGCTRSLCREGVPSEGYINHAGTIGREERTGGSNLQILHVDFFPTDKLLLLLHYGPVFPLLTQASGKHYKTQVILLVRAGPVCTAKEYFASLDWLFVQLLSQ